MSPLRRISIAGIAISIGIATYFASIFLPHAATLDTTLLKLTRKERTILPFTPDSNQRTFSDLEVNAPLVFSNIQITDDPKRIFEQQPPSPIDLALIISSLRKTAHDQVTLAYTPAWNEVDPISLSLLEVELQDIPATVIGVPLTRGSTEHKIPQPLLPSSIPSENPGPVPAVNRLAIQPATFGGKNTLVGFTQIETETPDIAAPHLIAKWGDRLIFSSSVLSLAQIENCALEDFIFLPGRSLQLGKSGPLIPIDEFGRLVPPKNQPFPPQAIPAESLVTDDLFLSSSSIAFISPSGSDLAAQLSLLSLSPHPGNSISLERIPFWLQLTGIVVIALFLALTRGRHHISPFCSLTAFLLIVCALFVLSELTLWISPLALIATWLGAHCIPANSSSACSAGNVHADC